MLNLSFTRIPINNKLNCYNFRYQGADRVSDHVNRPVSRKTFDKNDYRGTKESKVKVL